MRRLRPVGKTRNLETKLWIVMPVFNDWDSATVTVLQLCEIGLQCPVTLVVVDDGSTQQKEKNLFTNTLLGHSTNSNFAIHILDSHANSGNQIAIMQGLSYISKMASEPDLIAVMDADGEDKPEDLPKLFSKLLLGNVDVVVARRGSRHQSLGFLVMHTLFRFTFKLLTSKSVDFGNFMIFRQRLLRSILHKSKKSGNSLPGIVLSISPEIERVTINRGKRNFGYSRTGLDGLIIWGMELIAPFSKLILARVLRISLFICFLLILVASILLGLRLLTDVLIPGTASTLLLALLALLLILIFLSCTAVLSFSKLETIADRFSGTYPTSFIAEYDVKILPVRGKRD